MSNFDIVIESKIDISNDEDIHEFEKICCDNDIKLISRYNLDRNNQITNSFLDSAISIFIGSDFINEIIEGTITGVLSSVIISCITKIIKKFKSRKSYSNMEEIQLKSDKARLLIRKTNLSDDEVKNAIDAFFKVSNSNPNYNEKIVVMNNNNIETLDILDFVNKYCRTEKKNG